VVNIVLEGHRSIIKAEWYNEGLKEAEPSDKGYLLLLALYDLHVVKYGDNI